MEAKPKRSSGSSAPMCWSQLPQHFLSCFNYPITKLLQTPSQTGPLCWMVREIQGWAWVSSHLLQRCLDSKGRSDEHSYRNRMQGRPGRLGAEKQHARDTHRWGRPFLSNWTRVKELSVERMTRNEET